MSRAKNKLTIATKYHHCVYCDKQISMGDLHYNIMRREGGINWSMHAHESCYKLMEEWDRLLEYYNLPYLLQQAYGVLEATHMHLDKIYYDYFKNFGPYHYENAMMWLNLRHNDSFFRDFDDSRNRGF